MSERINALERQFRALHGRLLKELTKGGVSVDDLLQALTLLPLAFSQQYEDTIQNMLPNLEKEEIIRKLFLRLNPLFSFIDYELLQYLVSEFGSPELKKDMTSYAEKIQMFKKVTTISELIIDRWPGLKVPDLDHKMLRTKFQADPKSYTLEKLDDFRNHLYSELRLTICQGFNPRLVGTCQLVHCYVVCTHCGCPGVNPSIRPNGQLIFSG